jgi:endo-1,4-beta-mannosidase
MFHIPKQIVTNEAKQPVAVLIDYTDCLELEKFLMERTVPAFEQTTWQAQWQQLAQQVDSAWQSPLSAIELLAEMRR